MIREFRLQEAARWLGVEPLAMDVGFAGVSTDTRTLAKGDLFVALRGDQFDGHRFLAKAGDAGAVATIVDTVDESVDLPQLVVPDTLKALGQLGLHHRLESGACFIGVTGSSGKTTVKEMLAAILGNVGPTLATRGNLNNHIGVPLTLLELSAEHQYAVIEMGASGLGEIAYTVALAKPDVALITNAGDAHLEGFGSYDNIVRAKGEIIDGVPNAGTVVLNADDPAFERWRQRAGGRRIVSVSAGGKKADVRCLAIRPLAAGYDIDVEGPDGWQGTLQLALSGEHNVGNALLALAAARAAGASMEAVRQGLAQVRPAKGRLQTEVLGEQLTVINDSYNANPASMNAALAVLASATGTRVAVLGPMAELGPDSLRLHQAVGERARELGIERLIAVGDDRSQGYCDGFGSSAERVENHEQAVERLLSGNTGSQTVLVKGSRSSAMDQVVKSLKNKVNNSCCSG